MDIITPPEIRGGPAPVEWFTGEAWVEELGTLPAPIPARILRVTFAPAARTAWHAHPLGQVLHVLSGVARIGQESGQVLELQAGSSVTFAPGERHWHGASPDRPMAHLAIQATDPDTGAESVWASQVSDAEYGIGR